MVNNHENRRKKFYKRSAVSMIIISVACMGILGFFIRLYWVGPKTTTCFFHFNIDYRLGNKQTEATIITEAYQKLLLMYDKHPDWKFTVECQAAMIEQIYSNASYATIAALTTKLMSRGQMELICGLQYSQLFYMYPGDVLDLNLQYCNETLAKYGLLENRSRCLLFQEGQFGYGLATLLNSPHASNIDTVLVSTQQLVDFQIYNYLGANYPIYSLTNIETNKTIKLLQYDYLPQWEAGYLHSWNYLFDAELAFEDKNATKEFMVDQAKLNAYEQQLMLLETEGNVFMTCSEWVAHCETTKSVGTLNYYIPECNWGPTKYNSSYIWAANNGDSTDDGEMLANNYRCRQVMKATKSVYTQYKAQVSAANQTIISNEFHAADMLWLQATVTDATGIGPDPGERITAEGNVYLAEQKCANILQIIAHEVPELNVSKIQVDLHTGSIYNKTNDFVSLVTVLDDTLSLKNLTLYVEANGTVLGKPITPPAIMVSKVLYNSSNGDNEVFNLTRLDVTFTGTHDWANDSIEQIFIEFWTYKGISPTYFNEIMYSPSLIESYTKRLFRSSYRYDPVHVYLPLSNGLLFIPNEYTGTYGAAIIKNVTCRHTSWLWEYSTMKVLETEGLHMDAHHQFYIMENVSLDRALKFANRINVAPPWIVSKNVTNIQGNEVYAMYEQMLNKTSKGSEGSGEWWL